MLKKTVNLPGRRKQVSAWILIAGGLILVSGCGQPQKELFEPLGNILVWPAPPETPLIAYVGSLSSEKDLKAPVSGLEQLKRGLFGSKDIVVLIAPYAVAQDPRERLFVADSAGGALHIMDLRTRWYRQVRQAGPDRLLSPVALTVAAEQIILADSALHKIFIFDRKGELVSSFGAEFLTRPAGLACDPSRGIIYVADTGRHVIVRFDRQGRFLDEWGGRGLHPGEFNYPTQLWTDSAGKLYVCDTLNYRIQVLSPEGKPLLTLGQQCDRPGCLAHPIGVATDPAGNIYVADRQFENIQVFSPQGNILMAWGQEGAAPGQFWLPTGLWIDPAGRVYVADSYNKRIQIFQILETKP